MKRALVAFGGNALIKAGEIGLQNQQLDNAKEAAEMVVNIARQGMLPILVHGNGPQVGNVLIQQEEAANRIPPYTMDVCGSQTQGSMGYMLQRCIQNQLRFHKMSLQVATILTEVVVDGQDPAFRNPTKPVGPFYEAFRARQLQVEKGWTIQEDAGRGWRRQVPSPKPLDIVQFDTIQYLVDHQIIVIACGGGGIPIVLDPSGYHLGVEAVVDKDRTASLLGQRLGAETFIVLTGVERVAINFGKPNQKDLDFMSVSQAKKYLAEGQFPPGSMGPKIESAIQYVENGGEEVLITTAEAILKKPIEDVGTRVVRDRDPRLQK